MGFALFEIQSAFCFRFGRVERKRMEKNLITHSASQAEDLSQPTLETELNALHIGLLLSQRFPPRPSTFKNDDLSLKRESFSAPRNRRLHKGAHCRRRRRRRTQAQAARARTTTGTRRPCRALCTRRRRRPASALHASRSAHAASRHYNTLHVQPYAERRQQSPASSRGKMVHSPPSLPRLCARLCIRGV